VNMSLTEKILSKTNWFCENGYKCKNCEALGNITIVYLVDIPKNASSGLKIFCGKCLCEETFFVDKNRVLLKNEDREQ
jgi:hypothetical protein